ncbi:MAG: hypothetical protein OQL19_10980 [Gammaproteobacteria bacterium]|nr:hypothetical protein [Gammaproteobacteria bacterium]
MKSKISILLIILACSNAYAGDRLKGDELKEFWTDKTIIGVHHKMGAIKTYHSEDGSVHSKSSSGAVRNGKWWIDESSNKKCIKWDHKNKKGCHYTEVNQNGTHTLVHGKKGKKLVEIQSSEKGNKL